MVNLTDPVLTSFKPDEESANYRPTAVIVGESIEHYSPPETANAAYAVGHALEHIGVVAFPYANPLIAIVNEFPWREGSHASQLIRQLRGEFKTHHDCDLMTVCLMHVDHTMCEPGHKVMDCYFVSKDSVVYIEMHYSDDESVEKFQRFTDMDALMSAAESEDEPSNPIEAILRMALQASQGPLHILKSCQQELSAPLPS